MLAVAVALLGLTRPRLDPTRPTTDDESKWRGGEGWGGEKAIPMADVLL